MGSFCSWEFQWKRVEVPREMMKVPVETKLGLRGLLGPGETTESSSDLVEDLSHPGETSEKLILDQLTSNIQQID